LLTKGVAEMTGEISRKEFLRKTAFGALSLMLVGKLGVATASAATVTDNLGKGGTHIGNTAPASTSMLWVDTGNEGVTKYYNGSKWTPIRSTWDA